MKKGLNSFKEWALAVFASIIKTVAPTMAVKFFTVWFKEGRSWYKENAKERAKLFLPGVKAEVEAIRKLNLTEDQLKRRVWSEGLCEELLKQGNTSLWYLAKSEEAYNLVTATNDAKVIAEVFKTNTPSVAYLKRWLLVASENLVINVIKAAPAAFNDVKMADLKREYQQALLGLYDTKNKEGYNSKLAARRAEEVIQRGDLMRSYLTGAGREEEKDLFDHAMQVAVDVDYDFTKSLDSLERYHENWYQAVCNKAGQSSHLVSYLVERLPRVWFCAKFRELESDKELMSFDESYRGENWPRVMDARKWLKLAYENLDKTEVAQKALEVITDLTYGNPCGAIVKMQQRLVKKVEGYELIKLALSKLPEQYEWQLKSKLYQSISSYAEAREATKILPRSYRKGLRAKLVEMTCKSDAAELIRTYWPFTNWEPENAEKAVRRLAQLKALPFERLGELSKELKQAALDEVDVVAEKETLLVDNSETSTPRQEQKELLKRQLHPRAEMVLLTRGYHWQELKLQYISQFKMSEAGFKALVNHRGNYGEDEQRGFALVRAHAEKWGLTEGEYLALTRSPYYSSLAAPLKCCKGKAEAEEPNNDVKSE